MPPTFSNVPYGKHERQVLDFFKADTTEPAPLVVHIHGGGWVNGDKVGVGRLKKLLDQWHLGRVDQLSLHHAGPGGRDQAAGEVAA